MKNIGDTVLWDPPGATGPRSGTLIELRAGATAAVLPFDGPELLTLDAAALRTLDEEVTR